MLNDDLRNPIVKTVLLIAAITLIILFSFNAPPGSGVWGTLTAIISGIITTIKVVVGLLFAFAVSLFLFIVIFSLSVAIISRTDAVTVINSVVHRLIGKKIFSRSRAPLQEKPVPQAGEEEVAEQGAGPEEGEKGVEDKLRDYLHRKVEPLQSARIKLADDIASLQSKLSRLAAEVKEVREESGVAGIEESVSEIRDEVGSLQQDVGEIRKEIEDIKRQLSGAGSQEKKKQSPGKAEESKPPEEGPRIFEYLSRKADRSKLADLTEKTVEQGLSYTEAINFIISNMPGEAADVVEAHPALTREYIKSCRDRAR